MTLVAIESPFAGNREVNLAYARDALRDCIVRGEAAIASHLLYPQVLEDDEPREREVGIASGLAWAEHADVVAFYTDLGWSGGMFRAYVHASLHGVAIELRSLYCAICNDVRFGGLHSDQHAFTPRAAEQPLPLMFKRRP